MKTALCLSGQARFNSHAFRALADNLLRGLTCDVFLFLWRLPGQSEQEARDVAASYIGQYANIRACTISEQIDFSAKDYSKSLTHAHANAFNIQSMLYAVEMANALKIKYEQDNGFVYDCVIRARVDVSCFRPTDLRNYEPLLGSYLLLPEVSYEKYGLNDTFAFSSSPNMDVYASLYSHIDQYVFEDKWPLNPHRLLSFHLFKNRVSFGFLSLPIEIVREVPIPQIFSGL